MAITKAQKTKWIRALRSGEYTQDVGALRTSDGFCCLGVLCDVIDKTKWVAPKDQLNHYKCVASVGFLPKFIKMPKSLQKQLAEMNDDGADFTHIADWIKVNVKTID